MALSESTEIDLISVTQPYAGVSVRKALVIKKDGVEISRELSRIALTPSDYISDQPDEVKTFCNTVWTDAVKTEWTNYLEYQKTVGIGTSY